ncbi:MAG: beta-lactamase family protein [Gammaproteobacteria bacterium]|nr:beta-lactamase family protein [Gammaproteobacteria bacterium]
MASEIDLKLVTATPVSEGVDERTLERLDAMIESHIDRGWYPGAAIAMARRGKLIRSTTYGLARSVAAGSAADVPADSDSLWLLYSQTKPVLSSVVWVLVERGLLRWHDLVADYVPEFAAHGKGEITLSQILTHQAGFPSAVLDENAWEEHAEMRRQVCAFTLEWTPGSRVAYHGASGHWVQAMLIEAVTGRDYRQVARELVLDPLGLGEIHIGVPDAMHPRTVGAYARDAAGQHQLLPDRNKPEFWRAGIPGGGGYATAVGIATFYQMLLQLGQLHGSRILGPRTVQYVTRNHTQERIDERFGMPMHRGLGVHVRGETPMIRGLGSTAAPSTYGHGGVGTSYSWADPTTQTSFTYLTNSQLPEPLHSQRLDEVMNLAHASVVEV